MNQNSEDLVDRNIARLLGRWADPVSEERSALARESFIRGATAPLPFPAETGLNRRSGLLVTAAGLLICAAVYGSLFLIGPLDRIEVPGAPQSDPRVKAFIEDLKHADVVKRDRAAAELLALGTNARPLLEEAVKGSDMEIRVRGRDVLDRLSKSPAGKNDAAAGAARDTELENQRSLIATLNERLSAVDAECADKAKHINELQRQLAAGNGRLAKEEADNQVFVRQLEVHLAQIAELQKKLEEARKK